MVTEELSGEDTNHLYKLCVIPTLVVFYAILTYFVYLMRTDSLKTIWDFTFRVGWFFIFMPTTFFVAFEVLYHRKITKPLRFHLKRFTGRMLPILASALSYFGFLIVAELIFSPIVGDRAFLVGSILWLAIFVVIVLKLKRFVGKLDKGEW